MCLVEVSIPVPSGCKPDALPSELTRRVIVRLRPGSQFEDSGKRHYQADFDRTIVPSRGIEPRPPVLQTGAATD